LVAQLAPGVFDEGRAIDVRVLADAAAAPLGLPALVGRGPRLAMARLAAVHVAGPDVLSDILAARLGVGVRAVQTMRGSPCDACFVRAVRLQAMLRMPMTSANADSHASSCAL